MLNLVLGDKKGFLNPFFICTDNEAKMKAAFEGRYCDERVNFAGRVGCVEHALSTCISDVFSKEAQVDSRFVIDQISTIENFYNKRPGLARDLPVTIPEKSTTHPWRSYFNRLNAMVRNYPHCQNSDHLGVVDNLLRLNQYKGLLKIVKIRNIFWTKWRPVPQMHICPS